jgi:hypothetical protein
MTDNDDSAHERALLLALLKQAVDDYCLQPRTNREHLAHRAVALWFNESDHSHDEGYTFSDVCAYLNLNENYIRRQLQLRVKAIQAFDPRHVRLRRRGSRVGRRRS